MVALVLAGIMTVVLIRPGHNPVKVIVGTRPVAFNFIYASPPFLQVSATEIRAVRKGVFVQSAQVFPLNIPEYKGDPGAIAADRRRGTSPSPL